MKPRAFVVDDEPLAIKRLTRLLGASGRVTMAGSETDPDAALERLLATPVDLLFLDIHMPGMTGFDLLAKLPTPPLVVFTTAHNEHALRAFRTNAIDYLLKPVEPADLDRALDKLERLRAQPDLKAVLANLKATIAPGPKKIASRLGDRVQLIELGRITHFRAEDKLTLAITEQGSFVVDPSINELEVQLESSDFFRIHRATLVNLAHVSELSSGIGGLRVRLQDRERTELLVARDRARALKDRLGL